MKWLKVAIIPLIAFILTGCLYPNSKLQKNQVPNQAQLEMVQRAVDQYQESSNGLLPIKTKPMDTPIFRKYQIDFTKLIQKNLIGEPPGTAFENGGHYQYVIIHPEKDPTVKVLDLRTTSAVRSLQTKVTLYQETHRYPPLGDQIAKGVYELDYSKIGLEEPPMINSPYSQKMLPVYLDEQGKVFVDYRKEIYKYMRETEHSFTTGEDIRYLLTEMTPFVPAYSEPYTIKNNEPVFMKESKNS